MGFDPQKHCKIIDKKAEKDILFLHGFTSSKQSMQIIGEAYYNLPDYNLIFCDARGHGTRKNDGKMIDWEDTIEDLDELINERHHDTTLIGVSMGGTIGLTLGIKNPHVKQVFAISSAHGKDLFDNHKDVYEKRYNIPFTPEMVHEINDALPYHYEECKKPNKEKFFLIHAETDPLVPFTEMKANQHDLCLPNENVLVYSKKEIPHIVGVDSHIVPTLLPQTHSFIKKKLKK